VYNPVKLLATVTILAVALFLIAVTLTRFGKTKKDAWVGRILVIFSVLGLLLALLRWLSK
jgi:Ni,Fe-hydrogenase I cytochrome b subunit